MSECLKLTTFFGERDRHEGQLVADRLLALYGEDRLRASVLLRGAQGFGLAHHLRTDRLLTLSEDLPVVAVAVDTPERIEAILGRVREIQRRGLTTLERAQLLTAEAPITEIPGRAPASVAPTSAGAREAPTAEAPVRSSRQGPEERAGASAAKLTVYLGRHERVPGRPAFAAVCELLHREGVAGASALLGVDGTHHGHRRRARFFAGNARVPMMVIAVGATERIEAVLPGLRELLQEPLFTLERVLICKRDGELVARPSEAGGEKPGEPPRLKLTVVSSEATLYEGRAMHLELVRRLRAAGAAGATSLRGIWGFHGAHAPHGDRLLSLRRHVPVLTIAIDTPQRIAELFPIVDELTRERGLVTCESVPTSL